MLDQTGGDHRDEQPANGGGEPISDDLSLEMFLWRRELALASGKSAKIKKIREKAAELLAKGFPRGDITGAIKDTAETQRGLDAATVEKLLAEVLRQAHPRPNGWSILGDHVVTAPRMLVKGLLPYEGLGFIGGQSGAGKTFITLDLAVALASTTALTPAYFFNRVIKERVGVAIIAAEGGESLGNRLVAAATNRGVNLADLPIAWKGGAPSLKSDKDIDALANQLADLGTHLRSKFGVRLGVVILDTLVATFDLEDEDDNSEAAKTIRKMRALGEKIGALIIPVHHYGKTAAAGLRGGSGWRAGADVILSVVATRSESDEVTGRQINIAKSRDGIEGPIAAFSLNFFKLGTDEDGEDFGSLVVEPRFTDPLISGNKKPPKESKGIRAFRDAAAEALLTSGQNIRVRGNGPLIRAVRIEAVQHEFNQRYAVAEDDPKKSNPRKRADAQRQAFNRSMNALHQQYPTWVEGDTQWVWDARSGGQK